VRPRAGRDQHRLALEAPRVPEGPAHLDLARTDEARVAADQRHAVPVKVAADARRLRAAHGVLARDQRRDVQLLLHLEREPVEIALPVPGQEQRGFAQGLGGQGAGVHGGAARLRGALDHRDAFAEVRGLRGALLTGRAGADHDEVETLGHPPIFADRSAGDPVSLRT
jgi:hypothetical protein